MISEGRKAVWEDIYRGWPHKNPPTSVIPFNEAEILPNLVSKHGAALGLPLWALRSIC